MPISAYLRELRRRIGSDLVLMPAVAALVRDDAGRILVLRQRDGGALSLPAGAVDPGEGPARALVREVEEETGLLVTPTDLAGVVGPRATVYPNGDRVEYTVAVFACAVAGGRLHAKDGEATALLWRRPEDLATLGYPLRLLSWRPGDPPYFEPPG